MNAKEAREITIKSRDKIIKKELETVFKTIKESCDMNIFEAVFRSISEENIVELRKLGYVVETTNSMVKKIKW